jgi:hypothetical protein
MAVVTNTFRASSATTNRESLSDVISMITPEDTPIYSMIGKGKAEAVKPEWSVDDLATPARNIREEGDDYTFSQVTPPARLANFTQIFRKDWIISNTQEVTSEAGTATKRKRTKLKRGVELRKDVEFSIVDTLPSLGGNIRQSGTLTTWLATNTSRGVSGTNGGFNTGTGLTVAPGAGTQRAFTKVIMDTVMQSIYNNGGTSKSLVISPYVKSVFVSFMSDSSVAAFRYNVDKGGSAKNTVVATADYYEGPFGRVTVVPNRVMAGSATVARNAFFVDPDFLEWKWLRPIKEDANVAKTGDAERGVLIGEGTLAVKNEKGLGVAADLFGLTAST